MVDARGGEGREGTEGRGGVPMTEDKPRRASYIYPNGSAPKPNIHTDPPHCTQSTHPRELERLESRLESRPIVVGK